MESRAVEAAPEMGQPETKVLASGPAMKVAEAAEMDRRAPSASRGLGPAREAFSRLIPALRPEVSILSFGRRRRELAGMA